MKHLSRYIFENTGYLIDLVTEIKEWTEGDFDCTVSGDTWIIKRGKKEIVITFDSYSFKIKVKDSIIRSNLRSGLKKYIKDDAYEVSVDSLTTLFTILTDIDSDDLRTTIEKYIN